MWSQPNALRAPSSSLEPCGGASCWCCGDRNVPWFTISQLVDPTPAQIIWPGRELVSADGRTFQIHVRQRPPKRQSKSRGQPEAFEPPKLTTARKRGVRQPRQIGGREPFPVSRCGAHPPLCIPSLGTEGSPARTVYVRKKFFVESGSRSSTRAEIARNLHNRQNTFPTAGPGAGGVFVETE